MAKVTKSMLIGELLTVDPNIAPILISLQMQVFYKRIRNFLFSPVSTSLHLVYNCYIIQYVKD